MRVVRFALLTGWATVVFVAWSDTGVHLYTLLATTWGTPLLLFVWLVSLLFGPRNRWVEPFVVLFVVAAISADVPFRLRFMASLPSLTAYVRQAQTSRTPVRVGLFAVRETEVLEGGVVRLITTSCMFDDCGLAFTRHGTRPPRLGEDRYRRVTPSWWLWHRSW